VIYEILNSYPSQITTMTKLRVCFKIIELFLKTLLILIKVKQFSKELPSKTLKKIFLKIL